MSSKFPLVTVLGPTAVGKTAFAARLAVALDAEIISADSRQVYRGMDIGTGKDINDYIIDGKAVPTHLIDLVEPGTEYNVFRFRKDFQTAWSSIVSRDKTPLMCGGTGMYLESVLQGYGLVEVTVDESLRLKLSGCSTEELKLILSKSRIPHNTTDILDRERLIRAIEIDSFNLRNPDRGKENIFSNTPVIGLTYERGIVRQRITDRLMQRLNDGMIEEVQNLLNKGVSAQMLKLYGLEYKYITMFILGELNLQQMVSLLNTAIHQFAKRQMTWFRRMENKGIKIHWLKGEAGMENNLREAEEYLNLRKDEKKA